MLKRFEKLQYTVIGAVLIAVGIGSTLRHHSSHKGVMNSKQIVITLSLGLMGMILLMSAGCDRFTLKTVNIPIEAVDIVSISEERPAEVLFVVAGIRPDGCSPGIQKVHAQRVGNLMKLVFLSVDEKKPRILDKI